MFFLKGLFFFRNPGIPHLEEKIQSLETKLVNQFEKLGSVENQLDKITTFLQSAIKKNWHL